MTAWPAVVFISAATFLATCAVGSDEVQFLAAATLLALLAGAVMRRCGFWDCRTLFVLVSSVYVLAGSVDLVLFGAHGDVSEDASFKALGLGCLFLLVSTIPMLTVRERVHAQKTESLFPISWQMSAALAATLLFAYVIAIAAGPGFTIGTLTRGEVSMGQGWHLSLLRFAIYVLVLYTAVAAATDPSKRYRYQRLATTVLFATFAVFASMELLVLGDRRMLVMTAVGVAVAWFPRQTKLSHLVCCMLISALLISFTFVRNQPFHMWKEIAATADFGALIIPRNLEFGAYAMVGNTLLSDFEPANYPSYIQTLPQLIPGFLFEGRPEAPSQWFARTYFPEIAAEGGAYAFNFVVEAYLNAGLAGIVIVASLVGAILRYASVGRLHVILNPLAAAMFVFVMRLDLVSLLRNILISSLVLLSIYTFFRALSIKRSIGQKTAAPCIQSNTISNAARPSTA